MNTAQQKELAKIFNIKAYDYSWILGTDTLADILETVKTKSIKMYKKGREETYYYNDDNNLPVIILKIERV